MSMRISLFFMLYNFPSSSKLFIDRSILLSTNILRINQFFTTLGPLTDTGINRNGQVSWKSYWMDSQRSRKRSGGWKTINFPRSTFIFRPAVSLLIFEYSEANETRKSRKNEFFDRNEISIFLWLRNGKLFKFFIYKLIFIFINKFISHSAPIIIDSG